MGFARRVRALYDRWAVACAQEAWVVVIPGPGPGACARAGLALLPLGFDEARAKLARLSRDVAAIE
jgi:hypothetical protein